jgi:hypothetical protein
VQQGGAGRGVAGSGKLDTGPEVGGASGDFLYHMLCPSKNTRLYAPSQRRVNVVSVLCASSLRASCSECLVLVPVVCVLYVTFMSQRLGIIV